VAIWLVGAAVYAAIALLIIFVLLPWAAQGLSHLGQNR
jgi:hypothetical protein